MKNLKILIDNRINSVSGLKNIENKIIINELEQFKTDVKESVLKSESNNLNWIVQIRKVMLKHHKIFSEYDKFNIETALDGLERQNCKEVFGEFKK